MINTTKFWIEDITYLYSSFDIIPTCHMNLEEQLNCMTRIVLILFIILLFTNIAYDVLFLSTCFLVIILSYYGIKYTNKNNEDKELIIENYGKVENVLEPVPKTNWNSYTNDFLFSPLDGNPRIQCDTPVVSQDDLVINLNNNNPNLVDTHSSLAYCSNVNVPFEETVSLNQSLVGPPNPRTLVRPIIPDPIYDFSVWQPNDFIVPNAINEQKRQELYQNGYVSMQFPQPEPLREPTARSKEFFEYQNSKLPPLQENYSQEYQNYSVDSDYYNQTNYNQKKFQDTIDKQCGYDPNNVNYNLPINYRASFCEKSDDMKEYNKNLFSIPLQPGIYTSSQLNQPYASMYNLGISQDQPFLPTIPSYNPEKNLLTFTEYDPKNVEPVKNPPYLSQEFGNTPLRSEIYDPRLTGYGTSYRSYIEPVTGQPRFYYDDIDQVTQPNYITRNNLDIYGFASKIGTPISPTLEGQDLRDAAQSNYTDNQLLYRTELQQRLMHKNNNREWQQRMAPISTSNTFRGGGGTMSGFYR